MRRTAAVVGAGIGGLSVATALARDGWDVAVHERAADLSGAGTALGIWPSALRALDHIGLGGQVRRLGVPQLRGEFRRSDGSRIAGLDVQGLRRRTGEAVYLLSRPALVDLLHRAAPDVRFDSPVADARSLAERVDLVVAADGVFSRTRVQFFGEPYRARYTGATAWRGWLPGMPTDTVTEIWGAGVKVGLTPQEGGRTNWYVSAAAAEGERTPGAELARLRELVGDWHDPVPALLDRLTEADILRHDLYVVPRLPRFVSGRVALLGDAAHAMAPDLGRGACEAIIDAVALAAALRTEDRVPDALRRYDRQRRRRVQRLAAAANAANRLSRRRRLLTARDVLLRLALRLPPPP